MRGMKTLMVTKCIFFCKKLKKVKLALKERFSRLPEEESKRRLDLREDIKSMQLRMDSNGVSYGSFCDLNAKRKELLSLELLEESNYRQKSRIQWLKEGDRNTSFFHKSLKKRYNTNRICSLVNEEGEIFHGGKSVSREACTFFHNLFNGNVGAGFRDFSILDNLITRSHSEEDMADICRVVTGDEIREALFSLHPNKSPGPDGFNAYFFRVAWQIIGADFIDAVMEFFVSGKILKETNATILVLIPKIPNPNALKDFRPISRCNTFYKVISKILANRLKPFLPSCINEAQSAFVEGRCISENIFLAQELLLGYHLDKSPPRCAIKVDLMKAYDTIRWDFIWEVLRLRGFPLMFIEWVKACITTASFSISINGSLHGYFQGKRGLRQGDPLSPYLFVLGMDVLSLILENKTSSNNFSFHWRGGKTKTSHLCFADDLLLFCNGNLASASILKDSLVLFSDLSGLTPNNSKSNIFMAGIDDGIKNDLLSLLGFPLGSLPIRYLGVPLITTKLKKSDCGSLLENLKKRILSWTNRFLSFAGRLQLLKSVPFSLQTFWCSHFLLPSYILKKVEHLLRNFLWSGLDSDSKKSKLSWEKVALPFHEGGLGIRRLKDWNIALLGKVFWKICNFGYHSAWKEWMRLNLIRDHSFWQMRIPQKCSWTWRKVLNLRSTFRDFIRIRVGNGRNTLFWFDPWLDEGALCSNLHERLILDSGLGSMITVGDLSWNGLFAWPNPNSPALMSLNERETPSLNSEEDRVIWKPTGKNVYVVKDAWESIRFRGESKPWGKLIWKSPNIPKCSFIAWLGAHHKLITLDRVKRWGIALSNRCFLCKEEEKDIDHLFFECKFLSKIWNDARRMIGVEGDYRSWDEWLSWVVLCFRGKGLRHQVGRLMFCVIVYHIWKERNTRMHDGKESTSIQVFNEVVFLVSHCINFLQNVKDYPIARRVQLEWGLNHSIFEVG